MPDQSQDPRKELLLSRYDAADKWLETKRINWDNYEKMFHNTLSDSISALTKSEFFDPVLSTMQIERSGRVMGQLMQGKFKNMSKNDEAGTKLMNMTVEKYVIPNANSQFSFLTKARMTDLYSNIYGNFFNFVDWVVKEKDYIGPDTWLINIRDVFPQVGAMSLEDSDFVIIRSWKSIEYFESIKDTEGFKNVDKVIEKLKDISGEKANRTIKDKSSREYHEYQEAVTAKKSGHFKILSMYERGQWMDYVPGADETIRDIPNPNEDNELPVVCKYSLPLIDDPMGMGDSERGQSMQMGLNGIWNLYAGAIKMSIFPPVMLDKNGIASMSSVKWGPAEKWLGKTNNFAQVLNLTPQGTNTFNNTRQAIYGSLQSQFGTTFTNVSSPESTLAGKTPQAIKQQGQREATRDSIDRYFVEEYLTKIMKRFANLIAKKQPKALQIRLFKDEIEELFAEYPEFQQMYDDKSGKIKIGKSTFSNCLFDYQIVPGSTYIADKQDQQENLSSTLQLLTQNMQINPQDGTATSPLIVRLKQEGREVSISELITQILSNSGTQGWSKILPDLTGGDKSGYQTQQVLSQHKQVFDQAMAQMMQQSQGGVNQIPPDPTQGGMPQDPSMPQQMPPQMGAM